MPILMDHITIPVRDRRASARMLGELLGVPWSESGFGPFSPVYVNDTLTIDFDEADSAYPVQHYAFHVSEPEFAAILARIQQRGLPYRSTPQGTVDMRVNTAYGGSLVYWEGPDVHSWEILTRSYARQP
ncbi:MAG: VOC family protein [Rhodocyclaceae bacterium]